MQRPNLDTKYYLQNAVDCHNRGQLLQAKMICENILNLAPDSSDTLNLLGLIVYQQKDVDTAIALITKAVRIAPDQSIYYHNLGNAYKDKGLHSQAAACFRRVVKLDPDSAEAYFKLGVIENESGNEKTAVDCYNRALELNPLLAEAWCNLGLIMVSRKNLTEAVRCYQKAIQIYPDFIEAFYHLGKCYYQKNHIDRALACFRGVLALKPAFPAVHSLVGDLLLETGQADKALSHYLEALELEPQSAEALNNVGKIYKQQRKFRRAQAYFRRALKLKPDMLDALFNSALVYGDSGEWNTAINFYQKVLKIAPDSAETLYNLASLIAKDGRFDEAIRLLQKALRIKPDHADAFNNLGLNLKALGRIDEAIRQYRKAIEIDPTLAHVHLNLALVLLLVGEFSEGWREYEWRLEVDVYKADYRYRDRKMWDGKSFKDRCLLIHDDQGLGDTLQFVRFIPSVKKMGGTVILETRREIIPLLTEFPGIDMLLERPPEGSSDVKFDYYIPLLSIPGRMGIRPDSIPVNIPYLYGDAEKCAFWKEKMKRPALKIGIIWTGNKLHVNDGNRSCSLVQYNWLQDISNISLFSLQKTISPADETQLKNLGVKNFGPLFKDFADTAAVIENLDLVITVDTAVAHLAGAMGKATWILVPFDPDWRWMLVRSDSPWYPTVRLFRQSRPGDWDGMMSTVCRALKERLRLFCESAE